MRLAAYLKTRDIRLTAFAKKISRPVPTVHQWATNKRRPCLEDIVVIEKATNGAVRFRDWLRDDAA